MKKSIYKLDIVFMLKKAHLVMVNIKYTFHVKYHTPPPEHHIVEAVQFKRILNLRESKRILNLREYICVVK